MPGAGRQPIQPPGTDGDANQTQCRQPDGGGHAPDLTVAPLVEHDFQPVGRYAGTKTHRRRAFADLGRRIKMAHAHGLCCTIVEHDAVAQSLQSLRVDQAFDLDPVGFLQLVTRMRHACLPGTMIGEQKQAFRVMIQAPGRI